MAVSFWLPKVIVILTVGGISCAFDDLLDRVRQSKSNDPEVRDFLNTVLRHRNDFKWIQEAASRGQIDENVLPLQGLPLKNKRSFYSSRDGYPNFRAYGYKPHRYIGYERPINDAYPYGEENESKYYQKPNGDSVYNKRNIYDTPQYDFLDDEEPDVDSDGHRKKREVEEYDFELHQVPANLNKRDQDMEKLLNEKIVLHSILHNKEKPRLRKVFKDTYEKNLPVNLKDSDLDQIQVFPNAEKGVLYAPGNKYEYKTDERKRCVEDQDDHEILEDFGNKKLNLSLEAPLGEFYYSNPHDILGITKDQQMEMHDTSGTSLNVSCVKFKRSIHLDDFLSHPGKRARKDEEKSIKIKIFDDGRLVKDIKKGEANSIVLTIKNDKPNVFQSTEKVTTFRDNRIMDDLSIYSNMLPVYQSIKDDNTLQKIDSIIQRDQASLRLNSQIPYGSKQKKDAYPLTAILRDENVNQLYHEISKDANKSSKERSIKSNKLNSDHVTKQKKQKVSYQRLDEIGTRLDNRNIQNEYNLDDGYDFRPSYKESKSAFDRNVDPNGVLLGTKLDPKPTDFEAATVGEHQNRLEDQSEPTSAAEQRELGRINNSFNTPSMEVMTTDKMMIIPFKKNVRISLEDDNDDDITDTSRRFQVKDTRDMIHASPKYKKSPDSESSHSILLSKNLKDADEVLDKLKIDLEKTIKNDYSKDKFKAVITENNYEDFDEINNSANRANSEDDDEIKSIQDDNVEIGKELESVSKVKKSKAAKNKISRSSNIGGVINMVEDTRNNDADEIFLSRKLMSLESANDEGIKKSKINENRNLDEVMSIGDVNVREMDEIQTRTLLSLDPLGIGKKTINTKTKINGFNDALKNGDQVNTFFKRKLLSTNYENGFPGVIKDKGKSNILEAENVHDFHEDLIPVAEKMRKLMSLDDSIKNIPSIPTDFKRYKRSITEYLGMNNDEDYSEDKVDYYDNEMKRKRSENNEENNFRMPQISFFRNNKFISKNKVTEKVPSDKKNKRNHVTDKTVKHKKDVSRETKRNLFTNKIDYISKRESSKDLDESEPPDESNADNNDQERNKAKDKSSASGENELDIIEKTQAILLHITNPPADLVQDNKESPTMRGEFDDNDDPNSKLNENRAAHNKEFKVKHTNIIKVQDMDKDDDIVGEIMKLVRSYKENERRKHVQSKNINPSDIRDHRYPENYDDAEESSFSHHLHKDKKAHPTSIKLNNCKIKPGMDHYYKTYHSKHIDQDTQYSIPKAVKEGYANVEMMNDKDKHSDNSVESDNMEMKRDSDNHENPMKFTPDRLDSFNDIIEAPRYRRNLITYKTFGNPDEEILLKKLMRDKNKRHAKGDDGSLNSQMNIPKSLDGSTNTQIWNKYYNYNPYYYPNLQRFRQQASPEPTTSPKPENPETQKLPSETTGGSSSESQSTNAPTTRAVTTPAQGATDTVANLITTTTQKPRVDENKLKSCITIETTTQKVTETTTCKPPKHHRNKSHKPHFHHNSTPARDETEREHRLKEKNRKKIKSDLEKDRQKEHEHLKNLLNGHIMLEIMDKFHERLKQNEKLYSRFGHTMGRKCATQQVTIIDNFREEQSKKDIKHAQLMLHQVIVMMNKIVADQVHRRSCVILPPTIRDFLTKTANVLKGTTKSLEVAEGYPLPQVGKQDNKHRMKPQDEQPDFLFDNPKQESDTLEASPDVAMKRKIVLIRRLLAKYEHMSEKCQVKVQPIKEYLQQHLEMLEKMQKENKFDSDFNEMVCTIAPAYLKKCQNLTTIAPANASTIKNVNASEVQTAVSTAVTTQVTPHAGRSALKSLQYDDQYMNPFYERNFGKFEHGRVKSLSEKYRKLVEAADSYRRKRQIEERLAHLFGHRQRRESDDDKNKEEPDDLSNIAFEAPLVYSLDE